MKFNKLFVLLLLGVFLISFASAVECGVTPTDGCTVSTSTTFNNGIYNFSETISIIGNNIILDCGESTINYAYNGSNSTYGFRISAHTNITIKNCILNNLNNSGINDRGIYASSSSNINITNNTIYTSTNLSKGIALDGINNSFIYDNNIVVNSTNSHGISLISTSQNNNIYGNNITGIQQFNLDDTINFNAYGIWIRDVNTFNNSIYNNNINTSGSFGHGISLELGTRDNLIYDNLIYTNGYYGQGIRFWTSTNDNLAYGNNITTYNDGSNGFRLDNAGGGNNFTGNNILTYGGNTPSGIGGHGIRIVQTNDNFNYISNNNISTINNSVYGIYEQNDVSNIIIQDNIINSTNYAINIDGSSTDTNYNSSIIGNVFLNSNYISTGDYLINNTFINNYVNSDLLIGFNINGSYNLYPTYSIINNPYSLNYSESLYNITNSLIIYDNDTTTPVYGINQEINLTLTPNQYIYIYTNTTTICNELDVCNMSFIVPYNSYWNETSDGSLNLTFDNTYPESSSKWYNWFVDGILKLWGYGENVFNYVFSLDIDENNATVTMETYNLSLNPGIVAYYKMDDNTTDSVVLDSSGFGNNGVFYNGSSENNTVDYSSSGKINQTLNFTGLNEIRVPENSIGLNTSNSFCVSFWFNIKEQKKQNIMGQWSGTSSDVRSWFVSINSDYKLKLVISTDGTTGTIDTTISDFIPEINTWYNSVLCNNATDNLIYVNSVLNVTETVGERYLGFDPRFEISTPRIESNDFNGFIDEVRIYNRTLSQEEIDILYGKRTDFIVIENFVAPEISVENPNGTLDYNYVGNNETLNVTFTDTNLESCWYNYNGTNITIDGCLTGVKNSTQFILEANNLNMTLYANDTIGNINSSFVNWSYLIFENSQTYPTTSVESANEIYTADILYDSSEYSVITGALYFNGTTYMGTRSGSGDSAIFTTSATMPSVESSTVFEANWVMALTNSSGTTNINLTSNNVTVEVINLTLCDDTNNVSFWNFTITNETNLVEINSTFEATFAVRSNGSTEDNQFSYSNVYVNKSQYDFCISPGTENYDVDASIKLTKPGFVDKFYNYQSVLLSNATREDNLYMMALGDSTSFIVNVVYVDSTDVEGAEVQVQRYYQGTGEWLTTEILTTNYVGEAVGHFLSEDADYRFLVYQDGVSVLNSSSTKITCTLSPCTVTLTIPINVPSGVEPVEDLTSTLTYSDTTNVFTYTYSDSSGDLSLARLFVVRVFPSNATLIIPCNKTKTSTSGILTCDITGQINGTYRASAYITRDSDEFLDKNIVGVLGNQIYNSMGNDGVLWAIFILIGVIMLGIARPSMAIIFGTIGIVVIGLIQIINIGTISIIAIVVVAVILLMRVKRE